jgi:hypothetical protein
MQPQPGGLQISTVAYLASYRKRVGSVSNGLPAFRGPKCMQLTHAEEDVAAGQKQCCDIETIGTPHYMWCLRQFRKCL